MTPKIRRIERSTRDSQRVIASPLGRFAAVAARDHSARPSQVQAGAARGSLGRSLWSHEWFRLITVVTLALVLGTGVVGVSFRVGIPLVTAWWLNSQDATVVWSVDQTNWRYGGGTSVSFASANWWGSRLGNDELKYLHKLHRVFSLDLADNERITDKELAALRGLDFLRELNVDRLNGYRHPELTSNWVRLTDACLVHLQSLARLENLSLSGNEITDQGLAQVAKMPVLKHLDLTATDVTDAGLVQLEEMPSLETVNLGATRVTQEGISRLRSVRPDLTIELDVEPAVLEGINNYQGRN